MNFSRFLTNIVRVVAFGLVVLGILEISRSRSLPVVTDHAAFESLLSKNAPSSGTERTAFLKKWHQDRNVLDGGRYPAVDSGLFHMTLGVLIWLVSDLRSFILYSAKRRVLLPWVALTWPTFLGWSVIRTDVLALERGYLHHSADSIAIGFAQAVFGSLGLILFGFLVNVLIYAISKEKIAFWPTVPTIPMRAVISTLVALPLLALVIYGLIDLRGRPAGWIQLLAVAVFSVHFFWLFQAAMTPKPKRHE